MATKISTARMTPALGEGSLSGVIVETDEATGLASHIAALRIGPHLDNSEPDFGA